MVLKMTNMVGNKKKSVAGSINEMATLRAQPLSFESSGEKQKKRVQR